MIGLAFLLFLAGLELDLNHLQGGLLRAAGVGFAVSLGIALLVGYGLEAAGLVQSPLSLLFSREATGPGAQLLLIGGLVLLAVGGAPA